MRTRFLPLGLLLVFAGWLLAGCSHLDVTPPASADRVLNGSVSTGTSEPLPPDSEVSVRILDVSRGEERAEVLGEQTIKNPTVMPVPFQIEYRADDGLLTRGVTVDARISVGGRLRYTTRTAHPITAGNVHDSLQIDVTPVLSH